MALDCIWTDLRCSYNTRCYLTSHGTNYHQLHGLPQDCSFLHAKPWILGDEISIFTADGICQRKNYWQIVSLMTQKSLFTATHALFFISPLLPHWIYCSLALRHWTAVERKPAVYYSPQVDMDGLVQERHNSSAMELRLSCINPAICWTHNRHPLWQVSSNHQGLDHSYYPPRIQYGCTWLSVNIPWPMIIATSVTTTATRTSAFWEYPHHPTTPHTITSYRMPFIPSQNYTVHVQGYNYKSMNLTKPGTYVKGYTNYCICIKSQSSSMKHSLRNGKKVQITD